MKRKILAYAAAGALTACSLIVERGAEQCSTNADCEGRGPAFQGTICSADRACILGPAPIDGGDGDVIANDGPEEATEPAECTTNRACVDAHGENWICVKPEHKCRALLDSDCEVVVAGPRGAPAAVKSEVLLDDNTVFFGFIMDLRGSGKNAGIARRNAVELAIGDVHSVTRGVPGGPGGRRRPIAFVTCSETKDDKALPDPKVPAKHLIDDLHVPAILGASNSDTTIDLFNGESFPKATLTFSPNALSSALSSTSDNGLFWRTSATSILQGKAVQGQVAELESEGALGGSPPRKLAIVYIGDAFGKDIFPHVQNGLMFNGAAASDVGVNGPLCTSAPCSNPASKILIKEFVPNIPEAQLVALGDEIASFDPQVVIAIGRRDVIQIAAEIEKSGKHPHYVFTQGSAIVDVTTLLSNDNAHDVRERIRGTRPLASPDEATLFVPLYNAAFPPPAPPSGNGVPGTYDIAYLLTYATLAAPGDVNEPLSGARINEGLKRVLDPAGEAVKVGTGELAKGFELLQSNKNLNVKGMSYTYDFDTNLGEAPGDVDIWCVAKTGNTLKRSGQIYEPATNQTKGDFICPVN